MKINKPRIPRANWYGTSRIRTALAGLACVALAASCGSTSASVSADGARSAGVRLVRVGTFHQPTYVTGAPGDPRRLFVVEKSGLIVVLVRGHRRRRPFLDISRLVNASESEQGLLSMVLAPDYGRSGRFYVYYTAHSGDVRVVEYRRSRNPDVANRASARNVLTIGHHRYANHNGGQLAFGPDGHLYVGVGDGGSEHDPFNRGQNTDTLLGKLLRIDPRPRGGYSIPRGNPFAGHRNQRGAIWAYGLRNPWRFSFDRLTGDLAIGDVGQDQQEEVDWAGRGKGAGADYGWSIFEGYRREKAGVAPGAIFPSFVTLHRDGHCAMIGGYFVRDRSLPALYGRYLYGDLCKPQIRSVSFAGGHAAANVATGLSVSGMSSFGEDTIGRIYAVSLDGPVYRLAP